MENQNLTWKQEYWDLLLSGNESQALELKSKYFPPRLFKFTRLTDYALDSIERNYVYLAPIDALNDPFEGSLEINKSDYFIACITQKDFFGDFYSKYGLKFTESEINQIIQSPKPYAAFVSLCLQKGAIIYTSEDEFCKKHVDWMQTILEYRSKIHLCSLTERLDSILMWAHYTDQHRGICIEYDFSADKSAVNLISPIFYTDRIYKTNAARKSTLNVEVSALSKSKDWEYEKEWRMILTGDKPMKVRSPRPSTIYLGSKFKEGDNYNLYRLVDRLNSIQIPLKQMLKQPAQYFMSPTEVNIPALKEELKQKEEQKNATFFASVASAAPGSSSKTILYSIGSNVYIDKYKFGQSNYKMFYKEKMKMYVYDREFELIGKQTKIDIASVEHIEFIPRKSHIYSYYLGAEMGNIILVGFGEDVVEDATLSHNTVLIYPIVKQEFDKLKEVMSSQITFIYRGSYR